MFGVHDVNGRDFSNRKVLSRQNLNPSHATLQYAIAENSVRMETLDYLVTFVILKETSIESHIEGSSYN